MSFDMDSTQAACALAWSQDDEHSAEFDVQEFAAEEPPQRWRSVFVCAALAAGVVAASVAIGLAVVALTPPPPQPVRPQQQEITSVLNDGTIAPFPPDKPLNT